jgi:hypothetical protein
MGAQSSNRVNSLRARLLWSAAKQFFLLPIHFLARSVPEKHGSRSADTRGTPAGGLRLATLSIGRSGTRPSAGQQRCFIEQKRSLDEPDLSWCLRLDHPLA